MTRRLLLLLPLLAAGCGQPAAVPAGKPKVVATFSVLSEFAGRSAGTPSRW